MDELREVASLLRARPGFELSGVDTGSTPGFSHGKKRGVAALHEGALELAELQEKAQMIDVFCRTTGCHFVTLRMEGGQLQCLQMMLQ